MICAFHFTGERITSPGEFELRFSQLPPWAQKQVLSRPSMADNVCPIAPDEVKCALIEGGGVGKGPAPLEGKWAEVCVCVSVCPLYRCGQILCQA